MLDLLSIKEIAKQLDKPESTIRTWKRRGDIPQNCFVKIGGTVFIKEKQFNEWVEKL